MKIGSLVVEFLSDTSNYSKGVRDVQMSLDGTVAKTKELSVASKATSTDLLLLAGTATAAGYAIVRTGLAAGQTVQELNDLSYTTGITTQKIQQMQYAAKISGTDFSNVSNGVNELTLSIAEFSDESSGAHKAFSQLGIDPTGRPVDEVFDKTAKALVGVKDETQRNAIASELLGRNWKTLLPYIQTYVDKQDEISRAPVYSENEKKQLEESKVAWDKLINSVTIYSGKIISLSETMRARANVFNPIAWLTGQNDYLSEKKGTTGGLDYGGAPSSPITSLSDPFSGLNQKEAEIRHLTDYTIPALEQKLKQLQATGTAKEVADASLALIEAKENLSKLMSEKSDEEKRKTEALTDAYKDYNNELKSARDSQQALINLQDDTVFDLQAAGTDVSQARQVMMSYYKSRNSLMRNYAADVVDVEVSQGTFNTIAAGGDLSGISGTSEFETAQAQKAAAAGGITITGPIYLNGDKSFENYLSSARASAGIRNRL